MTHFQSDQSKKFLPFEINEISSEIRKKAEIELGETDEIRELALKRLKNLIKGDSRIKMCLMDDRYLLIYLRKNKFKVERAFKQMIKGLNVKTRCGMLEPNFNQLRSAIEDGVISVLPYRDSDGCVIGMMQLDGWDPEHYSVEDLLRFSAHLAIICVDFHETTQICGIKVIFDPKGLCFEHLKYLSVKLLKYLYLGSTNIFPARVSAVHILNGSTVVQYAWNIVKLWISSKIRDRVIIHDENQASLLDYFDPTLLPVKYGGTLKLDNSHLLKKLDDNKDRYNDVWSIGYES